MKNRISLLLFTIVLIFCVGTLCACDLFGGAEDSGKYTSPSKDKTERVDQDIYAVYQLYLSNGGKLTYDEWLATIKGEKGDKGDQGLRGEKGDKGEQGIQGEKGVDGLTPFIGENGNWWIGTTDTGTPATSTGGGTADNVFFIGKCGENVTWTMYKDGRLVITGEGEMDLSRPWLAFAQLITNVTIEEGITSVIDWAFEDCTSVERVDIPDSVAELGIGVFFGCYSLTEVRIPNGITTIKENLFTSCRSLASIIIPDSVTIIQRYAFARCDSLASIIIPDSVKSIGSYAFSYCSSLTSVAIGSGVTSIQNGAFECCYKLAEVFNKSSLNITKGEEAWQNGFAGYYAKAVYTTPYESKLSTDENGYILYTDGEKISLIGYTGTDTVFTLPAGITEINQGAFYGNERIANVKIPDSVTSIGDSAFWGCASLTSITIPNGVTFSGNYVFYDCISLTSITIPDSLTGIGGYVFYNCTSLTSILFDGTIEQWNAIGNSLGWNDNTGAYKVFCTDGTLNKDGTLYEE